MSKNNRHKPSISLSMIIKNEEKFLEGCLESVKGLVDEIIIADTGSTDHSKEIASRFGAKVIDFPWVGDFSAARNCSLEHCTRDWVLYLDADERLKEGQHSLVHQLIAASAITAYNVIIENPHSLHQGTFNQENSYPRLFRKAAGIKFEGKVHEQLWPSLTKQKSVVRQSKLVIHHLGYDQGYDVVKQKAERNLELLKSQFAENPDDAYAQFQIGNSLVVLQRYEEAVPILESAIRNRKLDISNRASCYNLLAEVDVKRGNLKAAEVNCLESLKCGPKQLMAHWFLALIYFDLKDFSKAIDALRKIEQLLSLHPSKRSNQIASDLDIKQIDLRKRFGVTFEAAGQWDAAMNAYAAVLALSPQSTDALQGFVRCAERNEDSQSALKQLHAVAESTEYQNELLIPFAWHLRRINDHSSAMKYIDAAITAQPDNARAYALSARWKMEHNEIGGAERILNEAKARNLSTFELHKCGMELALKQGDVNSAFCHLELMTRTTNADLTPIKNRLTALALKLSTSPIS
jgi:glycosyltransferase involved in cell wall biosynthesis